MTNEHDPAEDNIPELSSRIEQSIVTPDPAAIHAGLSERQAFQRRVLGGAGAFVVILALVGGMFALTRDNNAITTETAADNGAGFENLSSQIERAPAVAQDSAPAEVNELAALVNIAECSNGSSISLDGQLWRSWNLPPEWEGQGTVPVTVVIVETTLLATDAQGLSAPFDLDQGQPRPLPCFPFTWGQTAIPVERAVPDIGGLPSEEAHDILFAAGIRSVRLDQANENVPEGVVVATSPEAGTPVQPDETIAVVISSGQRDVPATTIPFTTPDNPRSAPTDTVAIPSVAGLEFNEALDRLFEADLRTSRIDEATSSVPSGVVIRTDPPGGTRVGTLTGRPIVTIHVSSGPPTTSTVPAVSNRDAVLAIEADIDQKPGNEDVWLTADGILHAGELTGIADYWDVSQYWFDEQAELTTATFDGKTTAIVLSLPYPEEDEDPPNIVQVFLVQDQGLSRVLNTTLGSYGVHPIRFNGDGAVSYLQDGWAACRGAEATDVVARQRITLTQRADGQLIQSSSEDTDESQNCSQLAG